MKVAVFHPGTQHSWQTARALQELELLEWFATSVFYKPGDFPYRFEKLPGPIGRTLRAEFRRIASPALDQQLVRTHGMHEWWERIARRAGLGRLATRLDQWGNASFGRALAPDIRSDRPFALWGYNNSSREAFVEARRRGRPCILDRTIGDWRAYNQSMAALEERYGDWFVAGERRQNRATIENEIEEHELADRILVGCEFAADTVRENAGSEEIAAKVEVLEYCFDEALFGRLAAPAPVPSDRPVRFLFMGQAIPRKGIHHVLEAIAQFPGNKAELTIVGALSVPPGAFAPYADRVTYRSAVARADVPGIMAAHDVLLFPSYFEGAGLVLYEALAAGMALIQSDRAAIAVTPETGILLGNISTEALVDAMHEPIADRELLNFWRDHAQAEAEKYRFAGYRNRVAALIGRMGI